MYPIKVLAGLVAIPLILFGCGGGGGDGDLSNDSTFRVNTSAGTGGSISPTSTIVNQGVTTSFTVTPDAGFNIASVSGCGGSLNGNTYTTGPVTANCAVTASFSLNSYLVTATAGTGGSVSPTSITVDHGTTTNFIVTPDAGFNIASVSGCGGSLNGNTYTTGPVTSDCSINALFQSNNGIALSVTGVPAASTKLVAVVDGAGGTFRHSFAHPGGGQATTVIGVPAGTGYRVRVIALGGGGTFPSILAGGRQEAITVVDGAASDVNITVTPPSWTVDPSTPTQVSTGSTFDVVMEIEDPGDFLSGRTSGRLYWDDQLLPVNLVAIQERGTLQQISVGRYRFSVTLTAPTTAGTLYYQFAENSSAFNDPAGTEAPFLVVPDLNANQTPLEIQVVAGPQIALTVTGVPAASTKLVAVVDGAGGTSRHDFAHPGGGQATTVIGVPAGTGYRLRVIALGGGGTFPSVLAGGRQEGITVVDGIATDVNITVTAPSWTVDPSTPTQVSTGSTFDVVMEIEDPADFFSGRTSGRLYWDDQPLTANLVAIQEHGTLQQISIGRYRFSVTLTAPTTAGTLYYQFAENSSPFNDPAGSEAPFLVVPDLNADQAPLEIQVVAGPQIALTVTGVPAASAELIAVVDGAGGTFRHSFAHPGGGQATTVIGVPAGTGYRVRVITLGGSGTFPSVLAGGRQEAITVVDGAASDVNITVTAPSWTVDPSTPTQVSTGSTFDVVMEIEDPADFFSGRTSGRLYWDDQPATANLVAIQEQGTLQQISIGRYRFTVTLTAPTTAGTMYYQFGEASPAFDDPAGTEAPFLVVPDLNANQTPLEIQVAP